jgi:hypothetical protein
VKSDEDSPVAESSEKDADRYLDASGLEKAERRPTR